jgi:hypothetical protein
MLAMKQLLRAVLTAMLIVLVSLGCQRRRNEATIPTAWLPLTDISPAGSGGPAPPAPPEEQKAKPPADPK